MRQLLREGFVHNRAHVVAADFLTKHLSIHWREGVIHFAQHVGDGDLARQHGQPAVVAGTGSDRRPSRRLRRERFDPDGAFARRHVPELGTPDHVVPLA